MYCRAAKLGPVQHIGMNTIHPMKAIKTFLVKTGCIDQNLENLGLRNYQSKGKKHENHLVKLGSSFNLGLRYNTL